MKKIIKFFFLCTWLQSNTRVDGKVLNIKMVLKQLIQNDIRFITNDTYSISPSIAHPLHAMIAFDNCH